MTSSSSGFTSASEEASQESWITLNMMHTGLYTSYLSCASIVGSILSHPFFVITTQQQIGKNLGPNSLNGGIWQKLGLQAARSLGSKALFHGALVSQVFNVPASVVYLWVTEKTRESSREHLFASFPSLPLAGVDALQVTCSALSANLLSMAVCYPANLVVTKMVVQSENKRCGFIQSCRKVYSAHGTHGFSHGFLSEYFIFDILF